MSCWIWICGVCCLGRISIKFADSIIDSLISSDFLSVECCVFLKDVRNFSVSMGLLTKECCNKSHLWNLVLQSFFFLFFLACIFVAV